MRTRIMFVLVAAAAAVTLLATGALAGGTHSKSQATASKEKRALFAVLTGRKEVDANGNKHVGDPDGRGTFSATIDGAQICYGITVTNLDAPVAAHIHKGSPKQFGGIVLPLTQPSSGDPGASSDCIPIPTTLAAAILKNPHKYYVNVHTGPFAGGAVRGQLFGKSH
jgi:hypothetical protein